MSTSMWLYAAYITGLVLVMGFVWTVIMKRPLLPKMPQLGGSTFPGKNKKVLAGIVILAGIIIAGLIWRESIVSAWENPYQFSLTNYIVAYWPWLVGAVVVIVLFWKEPGLTKFLCGLLITAGIIVGAVSLIKDGSILPKQEPRTVTAQKAVTTVSVGINEPVDLYLSQFTITSHPKDKGVSCDLDLTQPFALDANGESRTGEFITLSPLERDRKNGQLYVTITAQTGTYLKEDQSTVDIICYDADPRT